MSSFPVITTVEFFSSANFFAICIKSASTFVASTPFVKTFSPASFAISEEFPFIMSILISFKSSNALLFLNLVAPTPTASKITGMLFLFAAFPANFMDSINVEVKVPMFNTKASAIEAISADSSLEWAITGKAPIALVMFAQSYMVTQLVI